MARSRRPQLPLRLALTGVAATSLAGLGTFAAASPATAAPTTGGATPAVAPAPGTNLLKNGTLDQPDAATATTTQVEGDAPTSWAEVNLDNETGPYSANLSEYYDGSYKEPLPVPNSSGYATEDFYEANYDLGSEGFGGQQTASTFGSVTQADNPQVSFATAATYEPDTSAASWAGSVYQVIVTSGGQTYTLRYFDPFTPPSGETYMAPSNSSTVKYITGPTLSSTPTWTTNPARSLNADLSAQFGISTYTVSSVTFGVLEDTTNPNGPEYPNETAWFTNLALTEGPSTSTPPPALPESPAIVELPLAAVALLAGGLVLRRRRRTSSSPTDEG